MASGNDWIFLLSNLQIHIHQEFMPISNQVKSPHFIPKAILDLEIKDEEWEDQDKEILEEIHNQSLEDSLIKDEECEDQDKEILEEIHN